MEVGVAEPREDLPGLAAVVGLDEAEELRQVSCVSGWPGADSVPAPGRGEEEEERPDRGGLGAGRDGARDLA